MGQQRSGLVGYDGRFIVLPRKRADALYRLKPEHGHKFDLFALTDAQELISAVAMRPQFAIKAREKLLLQIVIVTLSMTHGCPTTPHAAHHVSRPLMRCTTSCRRPPVASVPRSSAADNLPSSIRRAG